MPLRLLIADDSEVLRMGVRTLIGDKDGWQICGEAADGEEAVARVRELAPDVILLDLTMPVMNGFQAAGEIRRIAPSTKIVFFSVHEFLAPAKEIGADAFVTKSSAAQELVTAIDCVMSQPRKAPSNVMPA
jgi:DNA-binding NarL/FixJ family response regulator